LGKCYWSTRDKIVRGCSWDIVVCCGYWKTCYRRSQENWGSLRLPEGELDGGKLECLGVVTLGCVKE
jgi:hypothetical protein